MSMLFKKYCQVVFIGFSFSISSLFGTSFKEEILSQIPKNDLEKLDRFFQYLLRSSPSGYTLFGSKPISMMMYYSPFYCVGREVQKSLTIEKGWEVWLRYRHLFPSHRFVLKKEEDQMHGMLKTTTIYMIDKHTAFKAIAENIDLFQESFGKELRPNDILEILCDSDQTMSIRHKDDLLGILLGYGRRNAQLYNRWSKIIKNLKASLTPPFDSHKEINLIDLKNRSCLNQYVKNWELPEKIALSSEFSSLAQEFNSISKQRGSFRLTGSDHLLDFMDSPAFVGYGEDTELLEKYKSTRILMREAYKDTAFLEATLKQWMQ